jgi:hypothetical protein
MDVMGKAETVVPVKKLSKMLNFTPSTSAFARSVPDGLSRPFYIAKLHVGHR